jgi:ribosomal-protein-alanine N-acetyltransferase
MSSSFNPTQFQFYSAYEGELVSGFSELQDERLYEAAALDLEFFPNPWSKVKWEEVKKNQLGPCLLTLVFKESLLIGFSLFGISDPDTAHLYKILVRPCSRGSGLSSELLLRSESILKETQARSVFLEVEQSNLRALAFYQKHGYQVLVAKKGFYGSGRDAYALEHLLS